MAFTGAASRKVMPVYLSVVIDAGAQCVAVRLQGDLDVTSKDGLRAALEGLLDAPPTPVVFDLSALSFADCAGLSVLVDVRTRLAASGRQVRVTDPQPIVRRMLMLTGTDALLGVADESPAPPR